MSYYPTCPEESGSAAAQAVMQEVLALLAPINATQLLPDGAETDTEPWEEVRAVLP